MVLHVGELRRGCELRPHTTHDRLEVNVICLEHALPPSLLHLDERGWNDRSALSGISCVFMVSTPTCLMWVNIWETMWTSGGLTQVRTRIKISYT